MSKPNLRFNFGFLIEASPGTTGEVEFEYPRIQIEDTLFEPLAGHVKATRTGEGIFIKGHFQTNVVTECGRCLEDFTHEVNTIAEELFYYPPSTAPEGEYIMYEDGNIDLGPLVREVTLLEVPMRPICKEDCLGLCIECGQNLNEGRCDCEIDNIDPRMASLKKLLE